MSGNDYRQLEAGALRSRNPIAALDKGRRFVRASFRQPTFFPARGPQQDWAKRCSAEAGDDRELLLDFAAQFVNALTHAAIDFLQFPRKPLPDAWIRVVLVALPTQERGLAHAIKTRPVDLKIAPERPIQEPL